MWRCERDQLSSLCLQTPSLCGYQPSRCVTENAKSPASILTELCLWKQVHGVLKARRLKWFAIPFSSGPLFVRTLHHDPSILGGPIGLAHSFIVLDKAVVHVIILVSFLWLWFLVWLPSLIRTRGLWKLPDGRDWLRGKLGLVLMGRTMLSKSLIQFSVEGWSCVPSLLFTWGQTMVEVMKIMVTSLKRSHASAARLTGSNLAAGHHWPTPPPETPGHSRASLDQSFVGSLLLSPESWCTQCSVGARQESISYSCVSSELYGGVNSDLFQEGLCHTQVCCTQSPCPCGSPLLTSTSSGDAQT